MVSKRKMLAYATMMRAFSSGWGVPTPLRVTYVKGVDIFEHFKAQAAVA